jgi:hypothetical protein
MPNRIPLDPKLPVGFDDTPNDERSKEELDHWWDHPYGVTLDDGRIEVRCLNGGAWDRSTHLGIASTYDEACALAEMQQADYLRFRSRPNAMMDHPKVKVVRMAQRPDEENELVAEFDTAEQASEYIVVNHPI